MPRAVRIRIPESITLTTPLSNGTSIRTFAFSNMGWNDNAVNDNIRAGIASTIAAPPSASTPPGYMWPVVSTPPTLTTGIWSPTNCNLPSEPVGRPTKMWPSGMGLLPMRAHGSGWSTGSIRISDSDRKSLQTPAEPPTIPQRAMRSSAKSNLLKATGMFL